MADELIFHASRSKAVFLVLASIAFVVGGYFMRDEKPVIAWVLMIFFGLGIPLGFVMLFSPKSSYLRLDPVAENLSAWKARSPTTTTHRSPKF